MAAELIVWDFDGVLNRNIIDGRFIWADNLERDLGLKVQTLQSHLFQSERMAAVIRGQEDIRDAVAEWLDAQQSNVSPDDFLAYMFASDALPDPDTISLLSSVPARHVIGTNNEARRAAYIETDMGFGALVERIFASGRMGCAKPDAAYFEAITAWSGVAPERTLLVDDLARNCDAARALGWRTFHFTDATRADLPHALT